MAHPHREFTESSIPLAYLITFRSYGTWLHGDSRGSVDRFHNRYGTPLIAPNRRWEQYNERTLKRPPCKLTARRRAAIDAAIRETCKIRNGVYGQSTPGRATVHTVVSAKCGPEIGLNAFKANATRKMREAGCWQSGKTPWVRKGSKRWLWTQEALIGAIVYVEYEQGEPLP